MITAAILNQHLAEGGVVQVATHLVSTLYKSQHAGMFVQQGEDVFVKRGKYLDRLTLSGKPLVSIRKGRYA
jgi:hypothetical protein